MSGAPAERRLWQDQRGAALVEFAIIAPVLLMVLCGVFDLGYHLYANTQIEGAIYKAARDSALEGSEPSVIDARVGVAVRDIVPAAQIDFARSVYSNFGDVARPEDFTDVNADGACSDGEPFEDVNGNGTWDADRARTGQGGARDAVLYKVTVTFERPFPVTSLIGMDPTATTVARTVLRNQPYGLQQRPIAVGNCD